MFKQWRKRILYIYIKKKKSRKLLFRCSVSQWGHTELSWLTGGPWLLMFPKSNAGRGGDHPEVCRTSLTPSVYNGPWVLLNPDSLWFNLSRNFLQGMRGEQSLLIVFQPVLLRILHIPLFSDVPA